MATRLNSQPIRIRLKRGTLAQIQAQTILVAGEQFFANDVPAVLVTDGTNIYRLLTQDETGQATPEDAVDLTLAFATEKTLVLGQPVWKDWNIAGGLLLKATANQPSLVNVSSTNIVTYSFAGAASVNELHGGFELDHDWKEGTALYPHLHWYPTDTNTGNVKWNFDYYIDSEDNQVSGTLSITVAATGTAWDQIFSSLGNIDLTGFKIGGQCHFRLWRDPTDVADTYASPAALATVGVHYQIDTIGSRQVDSK